MLRPYIRTAVHYIRTLIHSALHPRHRLSRPFADLIDLAALVDDHEPREAD
jgi:hypothetical protein